MGTFLPIEENGKLINGKKGDGVVVEFITQLPLTEGNYNLTLVLSQPLNENTAVFCDYVENAYLFKVAKRNPNRIWNLVYIKNEYKVNYVSDAIKR